VLSCGWQSPDILGIVSSVVEAKRRSEPQSGSAGGAAVRGERHLLVVDDDEGVRRIVAELLSDEGYEPSTAESAQDALAQMADGPFPLVITDLKMPEVDGLEFLRALRQEHPDTAVIMMTGYGQVASAVEALKLGAADYLTKPIRVNHLSASVLRALDRRRLELESRNYQSDLEAAVREKTAEVERAYQEIGEVYRLTLEALVTALDAREAETGHHSQRVVRYSLAIADRLDVQGVERENLARGALLHDIGKIGVPDHILLKPGPLDEEEWVQMRKHPEIGARILSDISFLAPAAEIVLMHQETWDGSGYPLGRAGEDIPLGARIFAGADTLDAIVSDRPYRRGRPLSYAREEIQRVSGSQFDPRVVQAFMEISDEEWLALRDAGSPYRSKPE
jgi:putative nucleotidyltransferase with HDIG domain